MRGRFGSRPSGIYSPLRRAQSCTQDSVTRSPSFDSFLRPWGPDPPEMTTPEIYPPQRSEPPSPQNCCRKREGERERDSVRKREYEQCGICVEALDITAIFWIV